MCEAFLEWSGVTYLLEKIKALFAKKQDILVSGENIKTINGTSILGNGNITVSGGDADLSDVAAEAEAYSSSTPTASVTVANKVFKFKFGLVKGDKGDTGSSSSLTVDIIRTIFIYKNLSSVTTVTTPTGGVYSTSTKTLTPPSGWNLSPVEGKVVYMSSADWNISTGTQVTNWTTPIRVTGEQGRKGQIVYPAGIYSLTATYTCDEYKAPYVYDSTAGAYYVLNRQITWVGTEQDNLLPSTDTTNTWVKLEAFEALYAKIGIIANGLIGSAVFNGDWMFSQQGINASGTASSNYEEFVAPTNTFFTKGSAFIPNIAFNMRTGLVILGCNSHAFTASGTAYLGYTGISNPLLEVNPASGKGFVQVGGLHGWTFTYEGVAHNYTSTVVFNEDGVCTLGGNSDLYINKNGVYEAGELSVGTAKSISITLPDVPSGYSKRIVASSVFDSTQNNVSVTATNNTVIDVHYVTAVDSSGISTDKSYTIDAGSTTSLGSFSVGMIAMEFIYCGKHKNDDCDFWICRIL